MRGRAAARGAARCARTRRPRRSSGQARLIENGYALAFEVRRHAEDLADRDDARAADAGDEDVMRVLERRQHRRGQRRNRRVRPLATPFLSVPPSTVTKLGQNPLTHE